MLFDQQNVNAIRILSAEAITKAKSGHPGICMDAAPILYMLYADVMNYNCKHADWQNRDRFVLSSGHGSAMLYATLHLFGFDISGQDLANFRQLGSKTPGHPELGVTDGVDISTGALGQGLAQAVGFALAEAHLAAVFNRENFPIVDHFTYCVCGEGCLEEGIGYEACSFAGTQKLGKLILFYDCNKISIEGNTDEAFADDVAMRFRAQNWQVLEVDDVNNLYLLRRTIDMAQRNLSQPSVIICKSTIGYGTPNAGTAAAHGTPLTEEQLAETKKFFNWKSAPFEVPDEIRADFHRSSYRRGLAEKRWKLLFRKYEAAYPELARMYKDYYALRLPDLSDLQSVLATDKPEATRVSGGKIINELAKRIPNLLSGSADLTPSTKTNLVNEGWFSPENRTGRNIHFGIREHAMAAICNGIAAHGGLRVICSTFFVFSDYMKGAMRASALMKLPVLYVLTHDSIGVGEDGPSHEPVEQLAMLRAMPDFAVFRPCDRSESIVSFVCALNSRNPSAIVMTRQNLPQVSSVNDRGGYVLSDCESRPEIVLVSCGSEIAPCLGAQKLLAERGVSARVVSIYCTELFDKQTKSYKKSVIPAGAKKVCVEASSDNIWWKYASGGKVVQMNSFGLSGKMDELFRYFGFTAENIADKALEK